MNIVDPRFVSAFAICAGNRQQHGTRPSIIAEEPDAARRIACL